MLQNLTLNILSVIIHQLLHSRPFHQLRVLFPTAAKTGAQFVFNHVDNTHDYFQSEGGAHNGDHDDRDEKSRRI